MTQSLTLANTVNYFYVNKILTILDYIVPYCYYNIVVDGAIWRMWSFGPYALFSANVPIETRAFRW